MRSGRALVETVPAPVVPLPVTNGNAKEAPSEATRPVLPPSTGRPPSRLAELNAQLAQAAIDVSPEGEARYQEIVRQIAQLQ